MAENEIRISVRNLVEFIMQGGDIDNRRRGSSSKEAMQLGGKIHRKIQRQMGSNYHAEYSLKLTVPFDEYSIVVEGRADGILIENQVVIIDEIKGTYMDLEFIKEPVKVHMAQAMCYAYIYAKQQELKEIEVRITYCNLETEKLKYFQEHTTFRELQNWFQDLMEEYKKWSDYQMKWYQIRNASIKNIEFPFPYREGQRELVAGVYRTILRKKKLFVQAPTGIGKTLSTVFPAVKAVGEQLGNKIFYLTAKTITRTVAKEAFDILKSQGLEYKVLVITAKEKMCICEEMECNPEHCEYAKGHYDRVNAAVYEMINSICSFTRESIIEGAVRYKVCPFELCLDISMWVDAVICDYNYVFDPNVKLRRFFSDGNKGEYIFLVDEAHNLVERAREMYSASLYKEDFLEVKKAVKYHSRKLEKVLDKCNKTLLELKRECENYTILPDSGHFILYLMNLIGEMEKFQEYVEDAGVKNIVSDFALQVRNFLNIYEHLDENYVIYTELQADGRFLIKLFCVNTSSNVQECLNTGKSTVFFSATLLPIQYYKSLFTTETDDYAIYAESPFEEIQSALLLANDVSSKYTRRTIGEYKKMTLYIEKVIEGRRGNYIVFFPSYKLMRDVYDLFLDYVQEKEILCILQEPSMSESDREDFLSNFSMEKEDTLVAFCVLGGIFSEGIDLTGKQLIGTLIVGTGLPQISNEREILKNFYEEKGMNGFEYAFLYPGMNKVLQAAGRVIRTAEDKGVIVLLDERFLTAQYQRLFPREWRHSRSCNLKNISDRLIEFWEGRREDESCVNPYGE
jgi:DNA excision repair protein ERCC-2